jgi:hypothetical protein
MVVVVVSTLATAGGVVISVVRLSSHGNSISDSIGCHWLLLLRDGEFDVLTPHSLCRILCRFLSYVTDLVCWHYKISFCLSNNKYDR